jgi:hypothetical protein
MPKPFHELTVEQFADLLQQFTFTRRIESVHLHHTWRPNHTTFAARPPIQSIEGMYNFHTQTNKWRDIAQHITVDPRGRIWTGRDWNVAPASATGFNGNSSAGPFMIEMIGDFDKGRDPFDGDQRNAAITVVARLLEKFKLNISAVKFHNEMSSKSCPGSAIDKAALVSEIDAKRNKIAGTDSAASTPRAFGPELSEVRQNTFKILAAWDAATGSGVTGRGGSLGDEPQEEDMSASDVSGMSSGRSLGAFGGRGEGFSAEEKQILRRHVINLRLGELSSGGIFETTTADVERIFNEFLPEELERRKAEGQPLRLVFYAHGGLTSEESGIRPVLRRLPFWRENGLYPIFFCWETGLKETVMDLLKSLVQGQRNLITDGVDAALEFVAGAAGRQVWSQMKRAAELASLPGGGARMVASLTRDFWNDHHAEMEIHALGHSAGAIFHAHYLPVLLNMKPNDGVPELNVKSLHFLAPASTTALFQSKLMLLIGPGKKILEHTMYTMNKDLEKDDKAGPYNKSLLYFVSRAFETGTLPAPILGLEESLRDDSSLIRFYGLSRTITGVAKILFSKTPDDSPLDSRTTSTTHGDFDNESNTMNSVARRILGRPDGNIVGFEDETGRNEVTRGLRSVEVTVPVPAASGLAGNRDTGVGGARKALCIGIDDYPGGHALSGCVNDANSWSSVLSELGFAVRRMFNREATHAAILTAMRELIQSAKPGDILVIQYAGHGTSVVDVDGDEATGNDQALVPIDFESGRFLIDDEIRAEMERIPAGVNVTCFMDCCHSATNTRLFGVTRPPLPPGTKERFLMVEPQVMDAHIRFRQGLRALPPRPRTADNMMEVNFAACLEDESALESNGSGEFTRRAVSILRQNGASGSITNDEFQRMVVAAFGPSPRQNPKFHGGRDAGSRRFLQALISDVSAPGISAPSNEIIRRLEAIEARLTRMGG